MFFQTCHAVLAHKGDGGTARIKSKNGIGFGITRLGQFRRKVDLTHGCQRLANNRLTQALLHGFQHLPAGLKIQAHEVNLVKPLLLEVAAHGIGKLLVLVAQRKHVFLAAFTRQYIRAGMGHQHGDIGLGCSRCHGQRYIGCCQPHQDGYVFALHQPGEFRYCRGRICLIVGAANHHVLAAEFAAQMLQRQIKASAHFLTGNAQRPGQRSHDADTNLGLSLQGRSSSP